MKKKVAVLMGGFSVEREVSLSSAQGVLKALHELGHEPIPIDVTRDMKAFIENLETHKPDVVLNILHGRWGEDGCIQGLLEMLGISYSHSGVLGSVLSMNKVVARKICQFKGIERGAETSLRMGQPRSSLSGLPRYRMGSPST